MIIIALRFDCCLINSREMLRISISCVLFEIFLRFVRLEQAAAVKVLFAGLLRKNKKEEGVLSLNFVTLRCGMLTVTLRARFRARLFYQAAWNV